MGLTSCIRVSSSLTYCLLPGLSLALHRLQLFFVLDLKTGGDLEYYLLHMDRQFNEDEVRFFAAEILLGLKVRATRNIMMTLGPDGSRLQPDDILRQREPGAPAQPRHRVPPYPSPF